MRLWKCMNCGGKVSTLGEKPTFRCDRGTCRALAWVLWNPYTNEELADRLDEYDFEGLNLPPRVITELSGLMGLAAEALRAAPSETRRTESTLAPIRKGADPNLTTENAARIRATYEALLREVLDKSESGLTIDEGLHSRIEDAMEPKTEQPVAAAPCVAVPQDVWDWLMGENGDFEPTEEQKTSAFGPGRYWWRSELRKRVDERSG